MTEVKKTGVIGIVGSGSIGVAFAIVFARAGFSVRVYDPDPARRSAVPGEVELRLRDLQSFDLIAEAPEAIAARVSVVPTLEETVAGAVLVQECAPEKLPLKQKLFADLDRLAAPETILASSSSALLPSSFTEDLPGRARCLVGHPGNPPYLISVIEIVTAPFTGEATIARSEEIYRAVGLSPVRIKKEIEGFVFNRLQGAVLREAYCLVRDDVVSVEDVDVIMRDGLGLRWSVVGPFETADLNARGGIASHADKVGDTYARMGAERGQHDPWTPDLVAKVEKARRAALPLDRWDERVAWRDRSLMELIALRRRKSV